MVSCLDLRKYQDSSTIQDIYSKIVSGKSGYKAVIERKKELPKCQHCSKDMPCPGCIVGMSEEKKFCGDCGHKLR